MKSRNEIQPTLYFKFSHLRIIIGISVSK